MICSAYSCSTASCRKREETKVGEKATDFLQSDTQYLPVSAAAATKDGRSDEEWEFRRRGVGRN